jgi:nitrogen fixation NifU-like protein
VSVVGEAIRVEDLLAQVGEIQPDLVLLDWELPGLLAADLPNSTSSSTVEQARCYLLDALHALHSHPKVIALSGRLEVRQLALDAGADAFVSKGDPPERLLTALRVIRVNSFDRFIAELQEQIAEQERAIYSAKVIEQVNDPKNLGRMNAPDAYGIVQGWCGDTMEIYLRLDEECIREATFVTDGCGPSVACGNALTSMVQGMSLKEADEIRPQDLLAALDGLPEENAHCAELAVNTLREAIARSYPGDGR